MDKKDYAIYRVFNLKHIPMKKKENVISTPWTGFYNNIELTKMSLGHAFPMSIFRAKSINLKALSFPYFAWVAI